MKTIIKSMIHSLRLQATLQYRCPDELSKVQKAAEALFPPPTIVLNAVGKDEVNIIQESLPVLVFVFGDILEENCHPVSDQA